MSERSDELWKLLDGNDPIQFYDYAGLAVTQENVAKLIDAIRIANPNITDEHLRKLFAQRIQYIPVHASLRNSLAHGFKPALPSSGPVNLTRPPGRLMESVAEFLCSHKTYEMVLKPLIADLQHEYFEALFQKRPFKARWIRIRYFWSFCKTLGLSRLLKTLGDVWRAVNFH